MAKFARLKFNDPAPDAEILTTENKAIRLSSLWKEKTILLVFTRHFGCPQCKEMLAQIVEAKSEIARAGLTIAAVTQGDPDAARVFCEQRAPGIACLADPERKAYRAFGLERGSLWQVMLSPQVLLGTLRAWWRGHKTELPPRSQDVMQMSGAFIIGTDGKIRLPYYYDTIADHPLTDLLLRGVLGTSWSKPMDGALGQ
ncbi:MAG: AhpC/TSA family protein [Chloroflexi bacterium]|nr:AhpC/TSA family protein [Chloroflexota bacterium]